MIDKDGTSDKLVTIKVEILDETGTVTSSSNLDTTNINGSEYNGVWTWTPSERQVYGISKYNMDTSALLYLVQKASLMHVRI